MTIRPPAALTFLACALLSLALSAAAGADVLRVPHPDLSTLKPETRAALEPALSRFLQASERYKGGALGEAYGQLGMHYQAHELQEPARICYANAMSLDPDNHRWPYYLAVYHEETGNFAEATVFYRRSLELAPDNTAGATRLGLLLQQAGNKEAARTMLETVMRLEPDNAAALAGLAGLAHDAGESERAAALYLDALAAQPEATQLHYRLGLVYRALGRVDDARAELARQGDRIPSIADPLLALVAARKNPAEYYVAVGTAAMQAGELPRALRSFGLGVSVNPDSVAALMGLGRALGAVEQPRKALAQFDRVLTLEPQNATAQLFRGGALEILGDEAGAVTAFRAAVAAMPDSPQALLALANALMRSGDRREAAGLYGRLADVTDGNPQVRYLQGLASLADGDCTAAESALLAAYEADQRAARVIQALARLYATCPNTDEAKLASALAYASLLYNGEPGLETAATLAMALAANGRFDDAEDLQMQAIYEATRTGVENLQPQLRENLERYRNDQRATAAWPADHPVYKPPLPGDQTADAAGRTPAT